MNDDFTPINPKPYLRELINKRIVVTLKFNNTKYKGILVSTDNYFNIQLKNTEEFINDVSKGSIGEIFIRCNNVLWIGEDIATKEDVTEKELVITETTTITDISS